MRAQDSGTVWTGQPSREVAISLARVRGHSFGGPFDYPKGQKHSTLHQKFIAPVVAGILAVLVSFAYASPTDPTWIAGIYDNADYDDVVGLLTDGTGASSGQGPALVEQGPVAYMPLPEPSPVLKRMLRARKSRGPPVEPCDGSSNLRSPPHCRAALSANPFNRLHGIPDTNRSPSYRCKLVDISWSRSKTIEVGRDVNVGALRAQNFGSTSPQSRCPRGLREETSLLLRRAFLFPTLSR
jgi:hypothetical protein